MLKPHLLITITEGDRLCRREGKVELVDEAQVAHVPAAQPGQQALQRQHHRGGPRQRQLQAQPALLHREAGLAGLQGATGDVQAPVCQGNAGRVAKPFKKNSLILLLGSPVNFFFQFSMIF